MDLKQLILNTKISPENECYVNFDTIASAVGLSYYGFNGDDQKELVGYWTQAKWYCTDSWVGIRAYNLNGELVCVSSQVGRKYPQEFEWVSKEAYDKTRDFILTKIKQQETDMPTLLDWNTDVTSWLTHNL